MERIGVYFATREGQAKRIAEHVTERLRQHGYDATLSNVIDPAVVLPDGLTAAVLVASIHISRHEAEMVRFVRKYREGLQALPTVFLSVSMSQAGAERAESLPAQRAQAQDAVAEVLRHFVQATGWRPTHLVPVAGRLAYRQYNLLVRLIMKRISAKEGGATDTSRDHEYTDWQSLDQTMDQFSGELDAAHLRSPG